MWPKTVYTIRHAEKSEDPHAPNLSPQGVERAQALATNCEKLFGKLDCLFAAETSAGSARSIETIIRLLRRFTSRIWVLEYQSSGEVYFHDLAQYLLQGDSKS
jgi:hypothetical protein